MPQKSKPEMYLMLFTGAAAAVYGFLDTYYWSPLWSVWVLIIAMVLDVILAIDLSYKWGGTFESRKFRHWCKNLVFNLVLLGAAYACKHLHAQIGNGDPHVSAVLLWIPWFVYGCILFATIASFLKAAALMNYLPEPFCSFVIRNFDTSKNR